MPKGLNVDQNLTRKIAELARLELSASEVEAFTAQLEKVLGYMEQLQAVDVTGVEPMFHPFESGVTGTPLREDSIRPSPVDGEGNPKVLSSAPDVFNRGFKVPQIL